MWTRIEEQEDRVSLRFSFASCTQCAGWPLPEAKPYSCKPLPDCGHVWILRTPLVVGVWVLGSPGPLEASKHKIYAYPYAIRYGTVRLPPLLARSTGPCLAPPNTKCTRMGRDHSAERVVHTRLCVRAVRTQTRSGQVRTGPPGKAQGCCPAERYTHKRNRTAFRSNPAAFKGSRN